MPRGEWFNGLINDLKDPSMHILSSNSAVVIRDKYPKAKHHYLVLPLEDIPSTLDLNKSHIHLLEELYSLALKVIEIKQEKLENFNIGFHIENHMRRVHMHVISKDFVSNGLKKERHWNNFNTPLFVNYETLREQLQECGHVKQFDRSTLESLKNADLKCNQCQMVVENMPTLKQHLKEHFKNKNFHKNI